ncbi:hypothetical protein, partial [Escherichia coli]|uniref:hypothetical protein n=1 Tax=Escherichia coli TaxID=562 RepID=UPI0021E89B3F
KSSKFLNSLSRILSAMRSGIGALNIIINNTRKIIPPGKVFTLRGGTLNINIPGRSALLLGKTGEPPNYLYL